MILRTFCTLKPGHGLHEGVDLLNLELLLPRAVLRMVTLDLVALQPQSILKPSTSLAVVRELIGEMNLDKFGDEVAGQNGCRLVLLSEQPPAAWYEVSVVWLAVFQRLALRKATQLLRRTVHRGTKPSAVLSCVHAWIHEGTL